MSKPNHDSDSPWPHRLAVALACATFPLIWVGGLVTTYDAGMAVPDWPTTYGYNMFAYPLSTWIAGPWDLFIEHGHRLLGATVGLLTIVFVVSVFLTDRRAWMKSVACFSLVAVIAQGLLGGARVALDARQVAMIHGCFGPFFFAFSAAMCVFTSRRWKQSERDDFVHADRRGSTTLLRYSFLMVAFTYLQLVLGANLRHVSVTADHSVFRVAVMFHLLVAIVVTANAFLLWRAVWMQPSVVRRHLCWPASAVCLLVVGQLSLGIGTWVVKYAWPGWMTDFGFAAAHVVRANSLTQSLTVTAHVAVGSLILATSTLIVVRAFRLVTVRPFESPLVASWEVVA